ncbi:PASTA domain-containing protein [Smaragdicoccus niigatensis]
MKKTVAVGIFAAVWVVGCGANGANGPAVTTSVKTVIATVPATATDGPQAQPKKVPMPNVVCMNLQAAQDEIQRAGVFYSRSTDASGQGRHQILDRNWTVVRQEPAPGELIGEGDANLFVLKTDEITTEC